MPTRQEAMSPASRYCDCAANFWLPMPVNPILRALRSTLLRVINFIWPESFTVNGGPVDPLTMYTLPVIVTCAVYLLTITAPGPNDVPCAAPVSAIVTGFRPQWLREHDLAFLLLTAFNLSFFMWMYAYSHIASTRLCDRCRREVEPFRFRLPNIVCTVLAYIYFLWWSDVAGRSFAIRLVTIGFGCCLVMFYGMLYGGYIWRRCCGWGRSKERADEEMAVCEKKDAGFVEGHAETTENGRSRGPAPAL